MCLALTMKSHRNRHKHAFLRTVVSNSWLCVANNTINKWLDNLLWRRRFHFAFSLFGSRWYQHVLHYLIKPLENWKWKRRKLKERRRPTCWVQPKPLTVTFSRMINGIPAKITYKHLIPSSKLNESLDSSSKYRICV